MCDNKRQLSAINLCRKKSNQNGYVLLHKFQDTRLSLNKIYLELFCYTVYGECYRLPHVTVFWTKDWLHLQHILYKGFYILNWMYAPLQGFVGEYSMSPHLPYNPFSYPICGVCLLMVKPLFHLFWWNCGMNKNCLLVAVQTPEQWTNPLFRKGSPYMGKVLGQ